MRRALAIAIVCLGFAFWAYAHTVYSTKITWSRDVSRILYRHCASCHHQSGSAFSLMTYSEARPWAEAIKQQVLQRRMPPWNAVKGFGEFKNDAGLTQEDLEIIGDWVDGGAPEGNPIYTLPPPDPTADPEENHSGGHRIAISGAKVISSQIEAIGIEPNLSSALETLQVTAHRPNGEIEPLIWIENFNPTFKQAYYFRQSLRLPPGTKIEVTPRAGNITLILK